MDNEIDFIHLIWYTYTVAISSIWRLPAGPMEQYSFGEAVPAGIYAGLSIKVQ
jgi:hypothetical protein